jgi:transaldolase
MKTTQLLHSLGQSIWLDNITREHRHAQAIHRRAVGDGADLESDVFDHAIKNSTAYDAAIRERLKQGKSGEALFFELALEDITRAADTFRPIHDKTNGVDGWTSLEVSPRLAHGGDCETVLAQFANAGVNVDALAAQLQDEGAKSFVKSWNELMSVIASKSDALQKGN